MFPLLRRLFRRFATAKNSGAQSEQLAAEWLKRERGFTVVTRNWRSPHDRRDEIDLVCRDGETLVFVEVKARAASALVPGFHAVDPRKKRVLRRAAEAYLARLRVKPKTFRLDVVEVVLPSVEAMAQEAQPEVLHFENVALFGKDFRE